MFDAATQPAQSCKCIVTSAQVSAALFGACGVAEFGFGWLSPVR